MEKHALVLIGALLVAAGTAEAYSRSGWAAELATYHHLVAGTATIVDEDTFRVDHFYYDGQGLSVYFYLGATLSHSAFVNGLQVGPQLVGPAYSDETIVVDLPGGETMDDYNALSVWCVDVDVDFGSGAFVAPLPGDANADGAVTDADYTIWADNYAAAGATFNMGDFNGDDVVTDADYTVWADNYGAGSTGVPEPATAALITLAGLAALRRRR